MPTRTYLTTPPGREPLLDAAGDGVVERWVAGPALPVEPATPRRRRRWLVGLALIVVVALLVFGAVRLVTDAQGQDPAMGASAGQG